MAKLIINRDYLDMGIPELKMAQQDVNKYLQLAKQNNVDRANPMLVDLTNDAHKIKAAIKIAKMESKLHNLKQDLNTAKELYKEKFGE